MKFAVASSRPLESIMRTAWTPSPVWNEGLADPTVIADHGADRRLPAIGISNEDRHRVPGREDSRLQTWPTLRPPVSKDLRCWEAGVPRPDVQSPSRRSVPARPRPMRLRFRHHHHRNLRLQPPEARPLCSEHRGKSSAWILPLVFLCSRRRERVPSHYHQPALAIRSDGKDRTATTHNSYQRTNLLN